MSDFNKCPTCGRRRGGQVHTLIHGVTPRTWEVALLIYEGLLYKEIAERLGITLKTVTYHSVCLHRAWKVTNKSQVILKVMEIKKNVEERPKDGNA